MVVLLPMGYELQRDMEIAEMEKQQQQNEGAYQEMVHHHILSIRSPSHRPAIPQQAVATDGWIACKNGDQMHAKKSCV